MAGLLSDAEDREIRDAVKLVTDTFMATPIVYHRSIGKAMDTWAEDAPKEQFDNLEFKVLVEYDGGNMTDGIKFSVDANLDLRSVKLTINLEDLERLYMIDTEFNHKFEQESDYFTMKGLTYKVKDIYYDGPLSKKDALLIITGKISDTDKKFNNG